MPIKTVLAVVGGKEIDRDLRQALELCSDIGAHLSVLALGIAMAPTFSDYPVDMDWLERRRGDQEALREAATKAKTLCEETGCSFDFSTFYDEPNFLSEEVMRRAFCADLIVAGSGLAGNPDLMRLVVNGGLFDAMRPLLLLPASGKASLRPKRIILAWNSKLEASRAAHETLDLLMAADEVHVTMVDPSTPYGNEAGEPGSDIAAYLARHGVKVVVDQLPSGGRDVEDVLTQHALDISADLIVMGAYSHSRLRERVFGGVTASMLKGVTLPVLLAR